MATNKSLLWRSQRVTLYLVQLIFLSCLVNGQGNDLVFSQPEERSVGQFVGSISTSPNILSMVGEDDRASLRYSILPNDNDNSDLFNLGSTSGNLTFARRVDREAVCPLSNSCQVDFSVAVSGGNNFFTNIPVKVVITDINDNSPQFLDTPVIDIHINEGAQVNITQSLTTATDKDMSPEFGVNEYFIQPKSDTFRVEVTRNIVGTPQVSLVLQQKLDRETVDRYTLYVVAKDGGSPPRSGTLTVNVVVDDDNDNAPTFPERFYSTNFTESDGPGYEIMRISASDPDMGDNGKVVYQLSSIQAGNPASIQDKVKVDNQTGSVTLKESFTSGDYQILIDAHDLGTPRRFGQAAIRATVLDTVNNQPTVRLNAVKKDDLPLGWVYEDAAVGTVVAVLRVDDSDSGKNGNVSCQCLEPNFQLQQLQAGSYKLMVAKSLDRELNSSHTVTVVCEDQGNPSLNDTASLVLSLYDRNDNSPVFGKSEYIQRFVENNMEGDTVTVVNALDADDGQNAVVEYRLAGAGGNFTITPDSGVIKANRIFDREEKAEYQFSVLAVDKGEPSKTGTARVTVNIVDVNDVAPIFSQESYKFHVYENRAVDSVVGNVSVSDPDLGEGGEVTLSLAPVQENDDLPFAINAEGRISTLEMFDREEKDSYKFYVVATDDGMRKLSSSTQVVVEVLDVNDNAPTFIFPSDQNFSAYVNIPIAQDDIILQVDVFDDDENQNSIITYTIIGSNSSNLFRIGKFSGDIIANKDLNKADMATYSITINASDQGFPVKWQVKTLNLVIQSEAATDDDVIADQNVLIVACIVCFTVIVTGAVIVAICVLRRHDQQRKLHYTTSCCRGKRRDSDSGSIGDNIHQYDIPAANVKDQSSAVDPDSPYHQQHQHQHNHHGSSSSNYKSDPSTGFPPAVKGRGGHSPDMAGPAFFPGGYINQIPESALQRHDDFHSTSSAETGTGDSGHGSDEDMSASMEHPTTPAMIVAPLEISGTSSQLRPRLGGSDRGIPVPHLVQRPSALKTPNPRTKGSNSSVRFDPNVTDIYEDKLSSVRHKATPMVNQNNSGDSTNLSMTLSVSQKQPYIIFQQPQHQQHQQHHPLKPPRNPHRPPPTSDTPLTGKTSSISSLPQSHLPLHPHRPFLSLSQLSQNDDINDDSDMNTTTSGSYSVASDDVARLSSLSDIRDHYV